MKATIDLFFLKRETDGRLLYVSEKGAYALHVPVNHQTKDLTYKIELTITSYDEIAKVTA